MVNLRMLPIICHLFYPSGKPEGSRSRVAKGSQYTYTASPLDVLALKPSDFCNDRVNDK